MSQSQTAKAKLVRKRLINLVGTDEVSIRDQHSMHVLQTRLEEEYKRKQRDKERDLENQERRRIRKLVLEGVIQEPEKDHKRKHAGGDKHLSIDEGNDKWSLLEVKYTYPPAPTNSTPRYQRNEGTNNETNEANREYQDDDEGARGGDQDDERVDGRKEDDKENNQREGGTGGGTDRQDENSKQQTNGDRQQQQDEYAYMLRPYSARVETLVKEQTVSGMYDIAKDLVYVTEFSTQTRKKGGI